MAQRQSQNADFRDKFRMLSNIYVGVFCKTCQELNTALYLYRNLHSDA